jgi:hypothetical protein
MTNQMKILHLRGAQLFQILFHGGKLSPQEQSLVGRLAAVGTRRGEFASVLIWDILLKDQAIY